MDNAGRGQFRRLPVERVAPTVAPPSLPSILAGLGALAFPSAFAGRLEAQIRRLYPDSNYILTTATGRTALTLAVRICLRVTGRPKVVLPAYTSFSVAAAAAAAGAVVDLCDVDPRSLDFDRGQLRRLVGRDTAAVVVGNLFGYPSRADDFDWIRAAGTLIVDDAAQALGATALGRRVGSRGDLGILSFGRGKCVTTGDGGALLVNTPDLVPGANALPEEPVRGWTNWLVAAGSMLCTNRMAFGLLSRLPGMHVGESRFDTNIVERPVPAAANGLAVDLAAAVERARMIRTDVASQWREAFSGSAVAMPAVAAEVVPSYLRFPVFTEDASQREEAVRVLQQHSFAYVGSYPYALSELEVFADRWVDHGFAPSATEMARRLIALPCHTGVRRADIKAVKEAVTAVTRPILAGTAGTVTRPWS